MNEDRFRDARKNPTESFDRASRETSPGEDVSTTVVLTVEELTGTTMEELPLLERTIDVESLNDLFMPGSQGGPSNAIGTLRFDYAGCTVIVDSDGGVVARCPNRR